VSPDAIAGSPDLFPLVMDLAEDRAAVVRLSETLYSELSFLDERLLPSVELAGWAPWADLRRASERLTGECDFIFHIGHVGSTLLSRVLGASERVFSVREPAILRTLATSGADEKAAPFLRFCARVYRPGQKTLLKATSFVSEIAPLLMDCSAGARAILLSVPLRVYMATILAGPNSRLELKATAPARLARLGRRLGRTPWRLEASSEGELIALGWTSEICALAETAERLEGRTLWLDFEDILDAPAAGLTAALTFLHGEARPEELAGMLRGRDFGRYSKAPEYAYDADLRRRLLARARADHAMEIRRGVAWLEAAAASHPLIARAVAAAAATARG
jgi:hypothetical protein